MACCEFQYLEICMKWRDGEKGFNLSSSMERKKHRSEIFVMIIFLSCIRQIICYTDRNRGVRLIPGPVSHLEWHWVFPGLAREIDERVQPVALQRLQPLRAPQPSSILAWMHTHPHTHSVSMTNAATTLVQPFGAFSQACHQQKDCI